jgi:hypothetical protein
MSRPITWSIAARGAQFVLAYRLQLWMQDRPERPDQAAIAAKLRELAVAGGVGLTPHWGCGRSIVGRGCRRPGCLRNCGQ